MNEIDRKVAVEEIKRLMARRLRAMDTKDWALYDTCHAPDVTVDSFQGQPAQHRPAGNVAQGKEGILQAIRNLVDGKVKLTTVHHAHTPEIDILSPTEARGVWAMEDHLSWQQGAAKGELHGYGHYHETYRKLPEGWRIQSRKLTRLRVDQTPGFYDFFTL